MLDKEVEVRTKNLEESTISRHELRMVLAYDPADKSSLKEYGKAVQLFFHNSGFRNDFIEYRLLVNLNEEYREMISRSALALVDDDVLCDDELEENILKYLDPSKDFFEIEALLIREDYIRIDKHYRRNVLRKNKQVLYGAILLMYRKKFFRPNYKLKNKPMKRLTEKKVVQIMAARYKLTRLDKLKDYKDQLIQLASERLPKLNEVEESSRIQTRL